MAKRKRGRRGSSQALFPELTRTQFRDELERRSGQPVSDNVVEAVMGMVPGTEPVVATYGEIYSGPLPHPDNLRGFDQVYPGLSKLIIDDWQEESKLRREVVRHSLREERRDGTAERWIRWTGQLGGFLLIAGLFAGAIWLTRDGFAGAGLLTGGAAIVLGLINAMYRRKEDASPNQEKKK